MADVTSAKRVLITGAYGLIGNIVYAYLEADPGRYDVYAMVRRMQPSSRAAAMDCIEPPARKLRLADLTDLPSVQHAVDR